MSRGAHKFKQGDVVKALKAANKAGFPVRTAVIDPDGKIIIHFGDPAKEIPVGGTDWDDVR